MHMRCFIFLFGDFVNNRSKYISSALLLVITSICIKVIGAIYKIPLTAYIGAVGRGYFAAAYTVCLPVHALTMGCLPVALSRLVSKYNANSNKTAIVGLKFASSKLFCVAGFVGMCVVLIVAYPYSVFIADAPKSVYTIVALAPSVFFSCLAASYRGYYEGFQNMVPTSVSQFIEAVSKMILGIAFAKLSVLYMFSQYSQTGKIFSNAVLSDRQAFSVIYPYAAAAAMLGVTIGAILSWLYTAVYYAINDKTKIKPQKAQVKYAKGELISFAMPIMISCAVQSVFQFLDTATIQKALSLIDKDALRLAYSDTFSVADIQDSELSTFLYGVYNAALDFKNLVPGITMALGVASVPAISAACEKEDNAHLSYLVNSIYKYSSLASMLGGLLLIICGDDALSVFYSSSSPELVTACSPLVKLFGLVVPVFSLVGTVVFSVQAIGCPEKSIKSYVVAGVIRVALNIILVMNRHLVLAGAILSDTAGYTVMLIMNCAVMKKQRNIKFDFVTVILKPLLAFGVSYYLSIYIISHIKYVFSPLPGMIVKAIIPTAVFCILCFSLKLLNFDNKILTRKPKKTA